MSTPRGSGNATTNLPTTWRRIGFPRPTGPAGAALKRGAPVKIRSYVTEQSGHLAFQGGPDERFEIEDTLARESDNHPDPLQVNDTVFWLGEIWGEPEIVLCAPSRVIGLGERAGSMQRVWSLADSRIGARKPFADSCYVPRSGLKANEWALICEIAESDRAASRIASAALFDLFGLAIS